MKNNAIFFESLGKIYYINTDTDTQIYQLEMLRSDTHVARRLLEHSLNRYTKLLSQIALICNTDANNQAEFRLRVEQIQ